MKIKRFVSALLLIVFILVPIIGHSGWVDDWLDQKTSKGAGYFEGQKRGYLSGGTFSARTYNRGNEPLVSASPPKIKAGCGGIDIFGGGLSFVNFDYLVGQLEQMVSNAPMVFFDIGFNVLCSYCINAVKSAKIITDGLNSLQFDSCQSSKVIAAKIYKGLGSENGAILAEANAEFELETGLKNLYKDVEKVWKAEPEKAGTKIKDMTAGCPTPLKDLYFKPGKTILEKLGAKNGHDSTFIDLIRGFIGDVLLIEETKEGNTSIKTFYIPPCPGNKIDSADGLFSGKALVRLSDPGPCRELTSTDNMSGWAFKKLTKINTRMRSKQTLDDSDKGFLDSIPLPMYNGLKLAVSTENNVALLQPLSEITARAYANAIMLDLYNTLLTMIYTAKEVEINHSEPSKTCKPELIFPVTAELLKMEEMARLGRTSIQNAYMSTLNETAIVMEVTKRYEDFDNVSRTSLTKIVHSRR